MKTLNDTLANYCFLAALTENQNDLYNCICAYLQKSIEFI